MVFLLEHSRYGAMSHLDNGTFERSNGVPTVTVNCLRQSTHFPEIRPMRLTLEPIWLLSAAAMRADRPIRPAHRFQVLARLRVVLEVRSIQRRPQSQC